MKRIRKESSEIFLLAKVSTWGLSKSSPRCIFIKNQYKTNLGFSNSAANNSCPPWNRSKKMRPVKINSLMGFGRLFERVRDSIRGCCGVTPIWFYDFIHCQFSLCSYFYFDDSTFNSWCNSWDDIVEVHSKKTERSLKCYYVMEQSNMYTLLRCGWDAGLLEASKVFIST